MTEAEYNQDVLGASRGAGDPDVHGYKRWVGDKPKIVKLKEGNPRARSEGWPFHRDEMDYDPGIDEDLEDNFEE